MPDFIRPFVENSTMAVVLVATMIFVAICFLSLAWREALCWFLKIGSVLNRTESLRSEVSELKSLILKLEATLEAQSQNAASPSLPPGTDFQERASQVVNTSDAPLFSIQKTKTNDTFPIHR